jgi:hypothetical protein
MKYRRAWTPIYAPFLYFRIFGVRTGIFDIGTEHQILIPSENAIKKVTDKNYLENFQPLSIITLHFTKLINVKI